MSVLTEIEQEKLMQKVKCWWCGNLFQKGSIWSDSNKNGSELTGFKKKQINVFHWPTVTTTHL
ncbi:MAG: hypothetical protein ACW964_00795 [Candidatus Hodarchaeales archaeon]|jgi:hypothetical protein